MSSVPLRTQLERMTAERDYWKAAFDELAIAQRSEKPSRAQLLVNVARLRECLVMLDSYYAWDKASIRDHVTNLLDATKWVKDIT